MRFSERFFKFPIKIYDGVSIRRVMKQELDLDNPDDVQSPDWVQGYAKLPYWSLDKLYYHEGFSTGRTPEEVAKDGFDLTSVYHAEFGDFECLWPLEKFEKRLDEFAERYESYVKTIVSPSKASVV